MDDTEPTTDRAERRRQAQTRSSRHRELGNALALAGILAVVGIGTWLLFRDDGNDATEMDPTWLSYQNTPPYPDYTCGMTTVAGAATEVLRRYFGTDEVGYTLTIPAGITRTYTSLSQASAEVVDARVFGGMHFRTGCVDGVRHGEQVGRFAFQHELRPANKAPKNK